MRARKLLASFFVITGALAGAAVPAFITAGSGAAPAAVYMHGTPQPDVYMHG